MKNKMDQQAFLGIKIKKSLKDDIEKIARQLEMTTSYWVRTAIKLEVARFLRDEKEKDKGA